MSAGIWDDMTGPRTEGSPVRETHPLVWSVRREVWENRFVYLAPLIVASLVMLATWATIAGLPTEFRGLAALPPAKQHARIVKPYSMAPAPIMLASFIVGMLYALEAFHGERRERSILFWKSLPVSDRTTVAAKALIPMAILPALAFALSVATQTLIFLSSNFWLVLNGVSPAPLWRELHFVQETLVMLYGLTVHSLWFAPIYGWLLFVSAWARRAALVWAVLPFVAMAAVERIAFGTTHVLKMLQYRVAGAVNEAFLWQQDQFLEQLTQLTPGRFLASGGVWAGLAVAGLFLIAAERLRRRREPT